MHTHRRLLDIDLDAELPQTTQRALWISRIREVDDFACAICERRQNSGAVGNRLVAGKIDAPDSVRCSVY
jgi:hypothetical protein